MVHLFTLACLYPQVRILRLLRILGHNNEAASDAMNDLLAQVQFSLSYTQMINHRFLFFFCYFYVLQNVGQNKEVIEYCNIIYFL